MPILECCLMQKFFRRPPHDQGREKPQKQSRSPVSGLHCPISSPAAVSRGCFNCWLSIPIPRGRFPGVRRHKWYPSTTAVGPGWPRFQGRQPLLPGSWDPRMEGAFVPHLMEEEGPEGEIGSMVKEGYGCTRENDISMKEDDSFEKEDDTCNTTSSFSPSPAVSRRITMGVRGIRALEEWCRRAVQVIHKQMSLQNHRHSSSYD